MQYLDVRMVDIPHLENIYHTGRENYISFTFIVAIPFRQQTLTGNDK